MIRLLLDVNYLKPFFLAEYAEPKPALRSFLQKVLGSPYYYSRERVGLIYDKSLPVKEKTKPGRLYFRIRHPLT